MRIVIATDIFGDGAYLDKLRIRLKNVCSSIVIVSPYSALQITHTNEIEAYRNFLSECGHERFSKLVTREITATSDKTYLIGFSAGASAIWHSIGSNVIGNLVGFVGFYPTQLRNHLDLSPSCRTKLIFPCREESFDVAKVSGIMMKNSEVECQLTDLFHGFMNPLSKNYDSAGSRNFGKAIEADILQRSPA